MIRKAEKGARNLLPLRRMSISVPVLVLSLALPLASRVEAQESSTTQVRSKPDVVLATGHKDEMTTVAFSPDGRWLATGSTDKTVKLFDTGTWREVRTIAGHRDSVRAVAFSPDSKLLASGSWDQRIKLWDVATGNEVRTLGGHSGWVEHLAFSPNGRLLASGNGDGTLRLWDVQTGHNDRTLDVPGPMGVQARTVRTLTFSSDGHWIGFGTQEPKVQVWGREYRTYLGHEGGILAVAFSPDGSLVASGSGDTTVMLFDFEKGTALRTLFGHDAAVTAVTFTPDGKYLLTGSGDMTVRFWEVSTGKEVRRFNQRAGVTRMALSADGRWLAVICALDKSVYLWKISAP